jgi:hypothetical protein
LAIAIVTGMIATYPVGGVVWDYGQYALALERLGFEVYYLEDPGWMTYDPRLRRYVEDPTYGVEYLSKSLAYLSAPLAQRWHFRSMHGKTYGVEAAQFAKVVAQADVFVNVSGGSLLRDEYMACKRKILIDTDPGWNHFHNYPRLDAKSDASAGYGYRAHDFFFTYAERIGQPGCVLPTLGIDWQPTRPPVALDLWTSKPPAQRWTTVLTWKNHSEVIEHGGIRYGTKEMEFEKIETLPRFVSASLELAAGGTDRPEDKEQAKAWYPTRPRWEGLGWSVIDAHSISATPDRYRNYIETSRAEFSVAKNIYVATRSGWFSCRSVCYLAAGLPVVVQDTGFSEFLPTGEGLLCFSSLVEAADAITAVERNYQVHKEAAREMARQYFDSDRVLGDLLRRCGVC